MRITPLDVHEQTFRVTFRGFDPAEVDAFLQRVADELERLGEERDQIQAQLERESATRVNLEEALASARTLQQGMLEQARQEADILVNQAQLRADRILAEANEGLVALRREAQVLGEKRSLWLGELKTLSETLQGWVAEKEAQEFSGPDLIANHREEEPGLAEAEAAAERLMGAVEALDELADPAPGAEPATEPDAD